MARYKKIAIGGPKHGQWIKGYEDAPAFAFPLRRETPSPFGSYTKEYYIREYLVFPGGIHVFFWRYDKLNYDNAVETFINYLLFPLLLEDDHDVRRASSQVRDPSDGPESHADGLTEETGI